MSVMKRLVRFAAMTAALTAGGLAVAQTPTVQASESVAATVNDHMISTFDVRQRMRLMLLTSGGRVPESAIPQLQERALEDLIEERLKLQEAEELEFAIDDREVAQEIARIAAGSGMSPSQLEQELLKQGVSPSTIESQIRSRITWQRLVSARYRARVRVSEDEIDSVLDRLRTDSAKEQYLVSEICLPVDDPSKVESVKQAGVQLIAQMRQGAPFGAIANQFSVCPSAANGGDLGWVRSGELAPELDTVLQQLNKGSVSVPVESDGLVYLLAVRDKKSAAEAGVPTYQMAYVGIDAAAGEAGAKAILENMRLSNICDGEALNVDLGPNAGATVLPPLPASEVEPQFRTEIAGLNRGEASTPILAGGEYHGVVMCEVDEGLGLPSRSQIKDRLASQQLALISRRYLRDIRRDSSVDILMAAMGDEQAGSNSSAQ